MISILTRTKIKVTLSQKKNNEGNCNQIKSKIRIIMLKFILMKINIVHV